MGRPSRPHPGSWPGSLPASLCSASRGRLRPGSTSLAAPSARPWSRGWSRERRPSCPSCSSPSSASWGRRPPPVSPTLCSRLSPGGRPRVADTAWLSGAAPAFDEGVLEWLTSRGIDARALSPEPVSAPVIPLLTAHRRRAAYRKRLGEARTLVLPYLAGDSLLLSALPGKRTLGVAVGSDVLRRRRSFRHERVFRTALRGFSAVW